MTKLLKHIHYRIRSSIIVQLILCIFASSLLVTVSVSYFHILNKQKTTSLRLSNKGQEILENFSPLIAKSIWIVDKDQISFYLNKILSKQNITSVKISTDSGDIYESIQIEQSKYDTSYSKELVFNNFKVGSIIIVTSSKATIMQLEDNARVLLSNQVTIALLSSLFIFLIVHLLITRHLNRISNYSRQLSIKDLEKPLNLNRSKSSFFTDEFDHIVSSINSMREKLSIEIKQVKASEENLNSFFSESPAGLAIFDKNFNYLKINEPLAKMNGSTIDDHLHTNIREVLPNLYQNFIPMFEDIINNGVSYTNIEVNGETPDQPGVQRQWMTSYFPIIGLKDSIRGIGTVVIETTRRMEAEKSLHKTSHLLEAVQRSSPDIQFLLDRDGEIISFFSNDQENLYLDPKEFINKKMVEFLPQEVSKQITIGINKSRKSKKMVTVEYDLAVPSGEKTFEARIICLEDERSVMTVRDITKKRHDDEELQRMQRLESVGVLAGGIAHDFNNILMGLFSNISLSKINLDHSHESYKFLEKAEKAFERATALSDKLLTFSKGGDPIKKIQPITDIVMETVTFDLSGSSVEPVFKISDSLSKVNVDKAQLEQVVSNLTINAKQAMKESGHLYITLGDDYLEAENIYNLPIGPYIKLEMRDEGSGIPKEKLEKVFEPYFTTKETGNGLGLAVIHSIIVKHNGHIEVHSIEGSGTIFTIYLPAAQSSIEDEPDQPLEAINKNVDTRVSKILVMDDEEMLREVMTDLLEQLGHSTICSKNGNEAVELYKESLEQKSPFDCVIMDLTIPGAMGGDKAVKEILKLDKNAVVIVSSGYADNEIMANYKEFGFKGIIVKPYSLNELKASLQDALSKS